MEEVKVNHIYRHYKGKYYYVKDVVRDSDTEELYVVYQGLYENFDTWVRKASIFLEENDENWGNNVTGQKKHFELVDLEKEEIK
jgi:hypothetical protein